MCLNCGCGEPADDHGKPANITIRDLRDAAAANGQTLHESAQHIIDTVAMYERQGPVAAAPGATGTTSTTGTASESTGSPRNGTGAAGGGAAAGQDGLAQPAGSEPAPAAGKGTPGSES